ncbi:121_t:CDS:1, partial [Dentiscutata heterogama]
NKSKDIEKNAKKLEITSTCLEASQKHELAQALHSNLSTDWSEDTEKEFSVSEDLTDTASSSLEKTDNLSDQVIEHSRKTLDKSNDLYTPKISKT